MDPIDDKDNYKFGVFYYNPNDSRMIVPKRRRASGFTFNFARREALLILAAIILFLAILFTLFLGK